MVDDQAVLIAQVTRLGVLAFQAQQLDQRADITGASGAQCSVIGCSGWCGVEQAQQITARRHAAVLGWDAA